MSEVTREQAVKMLEDILDSDEDLQYLQTPDGKESILGLLLTAVAILQGDPGGILPGDPYGSLPSEVED